MNHSYSFSRETINERFIPRHLEKAGELSPEIKKALEHSRNQYLRSTQALLDKKPSVDALRNHLTFLRKSRDSYDTQYKKIRNDKQKKETIHEVIDAIDEAVAQVSKYVVMQLADQGIVGGAAYAYGPREGVHYDIHTPGRDHFQLALPFVHGRLVRQLGDLMCKSSREFWGLRVTDDPYRITCRACMKKMLELLESNEEKKKATKR
ncbi:hypothetical protein DWB84_05935 [Saccharophagus sp. K07]|jgi:hypothetical protein|uniref:hypothetical protein n=1 Tax=Saccharophagus sp. K07 TaxID=2283636 RepID=UPI001651F1AF|nr:hypothetical protein [Saccharophagus sp. K07]MBC6905003.1 hypothetical protein [Saccharophagus sp. K07]